MKKKIKRKARPIVVGHLEKISSGVFERYPEQITGLTGIEARVGVEFFGVCTQKNGKGKEL